MEVFPRSETRRRCRRGQVATSGSGDLPGKAGVDGNGGRRRDLGFPCRGQKARERGHGKEVKPGEKAEDVVLALSTRAEPRGRAGRRGAGHGERPGSLQSTGGRRPEHFAQSPLALLPLFLAGPFLFLISVY